MSSVKIPKWIGPVLCPVVFILLIAAVCFYYCYWKPRREKNKEKNEAEDKQPKKRVVSSLLSRESPGGKNKNTLLVDEEMFYGSGYYGCDTYTTYGPYCMEYCPLPSSSLNYCVLNEGRRPKVVYCPRSANKSRDTCTAQLRCKGNDKIRKCRVPCPKGECIKCPDLPMITEGNSTLSLCDEKEEKEQKDPFNVEGTGLVCACNGGENERMIVEGKENVEEKSTSVSGQEVTISDCCEDSGFEDH